MKLNKPDSVVTLAWLLFYLESIDYFTKYPSRQYLKDSLRQAETIEQKVEIILSDDLVQRNLYPDWLSARYTIIDPVEYFHEHIKMD